jgi:hypothetical protein
MAAGAAFSFGQASNQSGSETFAAAWATLQKPRLGAAEFGSDPLVSPQPARTLAQDARGP